MRKISHFLYGLSGDDFTIIRKGTQGLRFRFGMIGIFVLFVFFLSFISSLVAFLNLFGSNFVSVLMSVVFVGLILSIYLLLLFTLSKNLLPRKTEPRATISLFLGKYLIIVFIAIFISKPIEILLLGSWVSNDIIEYKKQLLLTYKNISKTNFEEETSIINMIISGYAQNPNKSNIGLVEKYKSVINEKVKENERLAYRMSSILNDSNFYTHRLILLSTKHPISWLVTLAVILVFIAPLLLKGFLNVSNEYYQIKKDIEIKIVLDEYQSFKESYNSFFKGKYAKEIKWEERYLDPPFNTKPKTDDKKIEDEKNLIDYIYYGQI